MNEPLFGYVLIIPVVQFKGVGVGCAEFPVGKIGFCADRFRLIDGEALLDALSEGLYIINGKKVAIK